MKIKNGLLIINLGTPENCDIKSVKKYLREFLSDKRVINLPAFLRYLLLYAYILPCRKHLTTTAYKAIWSPQGSPLYVHSKHLLQKLRTHMPNWRVALGMRYGTPSIAEALDELKDCEKITILPLYPQYSSAATGSAIEKTLQILAQKTVLPSINIIRDFYQHPAFIKAQAELIAKYIKSDTFYIFSYHGLPIKHLYDAGCTKHCNNSCPTKNYAPSCYRAQCFQTSRAIAAYLNLSPDNYESTFQSNVGRGEWIKPSTENTLERLAANNIKHITIACPSFVTDCLETLEEIGIRAKAQWRALGGETLTLVPCLNDSDDWIWAIIKSQEQLL